MRGTREGFVDHEAGEHAGLWEVGECQSYGVGIGRVSAIRIRGRADVKHSIHDGIAEGFVVEDVGKKVDLRESMESSTAVPSLIGLAVDNVVENQIEVAMMAPVGVVVEGLDFDVREVEESVFEGQLLPAVG